MYCTVQDVRDITGVCDAYLTDADITRLIETAERRCNARIVESGLDIPTEISSTLRDAAAYYTAAAIVNRRRIDLTRASAYAADGLSYSTTPDTDIQYLEQRAWEMLSTYISEQNASVESFCVIVEGE